MRNTTEGSLNDKGRDLLSGGAGGRVRDRGLAEHREDLGDATVGDPDLAAVEDPVRPLLIELGPGLDAAGVRTAARLGQGEGSEVLSSGELGQVLLFLCIRPAQQDTLHANRVIKIHDF